MTKRSNNEQPTPTEEQPITNTEQPTFRSGFVNIIGRPNAGKSTLMNALVGERMSIITHKPQTIQNNLNITGGNLLFTQVSSPTALTAAIGAAGAVTGSFRYAGRAGLAGTAGGAA